MQKEQTAIRRTPAPTGAMLRQTLLAGTQINDVRLTLAEVQSSVLVGGEGTPVILLHGPGANATHWRWVMPSLMGSHKTIAPDLPGHGASIAGGPLTVPRVFHWLSQLIDRTCPNPPALVGAAAGGAIAARFAARFGDRISRLVLIDTLGFTPFQPAPAFGMSLNAFLTQPTEASHDDLWQYCAHDLPALRGRIGEQWTAFRGYNLDRARDPEVMSAGQQLMAEFVLPAIDPVELTWIRVPVTVIWGKYDLATPLIVAESVAERLGWPLLAIDNCGDDPPVEQPEALTSALGAILGQGD